MSIFILTQTIFYFSLLSALWHRSHLDSIASFLEKWGFSSYLFIAYWVIWEHALYGFCPWIFLESYFMALYMVFCKWFILWKSMYILQLVVRMFFTCQVTFVYCIVHIFYTCTVVFCFLPLSSGWSISAYRSASF